MKARQKNIIIFSVFGVIIVLLILYAVITTRIPMNDITAVGNTAGNLNNGGYFCEHDGRVYFANAYDNYSLYSMNTDETDIRRIHRGASSYINAAGSYLYYVTSGNSDSGDTSSFRGVYGIYRSKLDGRNVTGMDRCRVAAMQLCGNYLYYENLDDGAPASLDRIRIDKKDKQTVIPDAMINPHCYANGLIYYNGTDQDHYLYALNTDTGTSSVLWEGNLWNPVWQGGYVYYMDVENNYRLCRYSTYDNVVEVLTNDRIDAFNVYNDYIYYQTSSKDAPALKRMYIDGSSQETVADGVYQNINITSSYVYFNAFGEPAPVYKTSTYGAVSVTTFDAAMQAAAAESE